MVVLHYTAMETADAALERLCSDAHEVSAHYLICEKGGAFQLVDEECRAWHAGAGSWGDVTDVNSRSIGIELANTGFAPFPEPQMAALETLLADILARHGIAPERVIGHSDMAPARKGDPGARFDWRRLALRGLSVWPEPENADGDFFNYARVFGYPVDASDEDLLTAFRLRFRPGVQGPVDTRDLRQMKSLAMRFPVDRPPEPS
jgi:N-acetylmuramoyl-L-alanine amidase